MTQTVEKGAFLSFRVTSVVSLQYLLEVDIAQLKACMKLNAGLLCSMLVNGKENYQTQN